MATGKPKNISINCRGCKETFETEARPLLKYYEKEVSITCPNCQKGVKILVDKNLLTYGEVIADHTRIFIRNESQWVDDQYGKLMNLETKSELELKVGLNCIGRNPEFQPDCFSIKIDSEDKLISRSHCLVYVEKKNEKFAYSLKDFNSSNGTYLNQEKLHSFDEIYLKNGDLIRIGTSSFRFQINL